jgi:hypothetical protein
VQGKGADTVKNHVIPSRLLALATLMIALLGLIITPSTPAEPANPASIEEVVNISFAEGESLDPALIKSVDEEHRKLLAGGTAFGPNCLKLFPRSFEQGEKLTGLPQAILAGIAGHESAGCEEPRDGPGNVMHIVMPDDVHISKAARLLHVPPGALNWNRHSEHSVVLGAVMLQDYYECRGNLVEALAAYRHGGPSSKKAVGRYPYLVLAHGVLALRHLWRQETDFWTDAGDPIEEVDLRSLAFNRQIAPPPVHDLMALQK